EERVDEAGRVADESHSGLPEGGVLVGPILAQPDLAIHSFRDASRARQEILDDRTLRNHLQEHLLFLVLEPVCVLLADDRADARELRRQRNVPNPTVLEGGGEDVALARRRQALTALEVTVDGDVAEVLRMDPLADDRVEGAAVTRSVDHIAGSYFVVPI